MDDLNIENIILDGLSFLGIFIAVTVLIVFCRQLQKRFDIFSLIAKVWHASHRAVRILIVVISLSAVLLVVVLSGKWPAASVWSFQGQENNDFERLQLPNLEISTTCADEEKDLAREVFKYKTGISSIADVRYATKKLHQALSSRGHHEYYVKEIVELKMDSFFKKIKPF